ncbi:MAG: DUF6272 family protein [Bacteroidia bacterium]|nr:DUF6272 family protein [Bacteroidia bacterium]MDW8088551.1 DUF6272 family protein [Bacteroidia bacterium]
MVASASEVAPSAALFHAYPLYRNMLDNSIVFMYYGPITPDLIVDILNLIDYRLSGSGEEKRISKKLFNIMVESLSLGEDVNRGHSTLLVRQLPYLYTVSIGRRINAAAVYELKTFIDWVNMLSPEDLREAYHQLLQPPTSAGLPTSVADVPSISILDLARKSSEYLDYLFEYLDENDAFFSLEARIRKNHS